MRMLDWMTTFMALRFLRSRTFSDAHTDLLIFSFV